MLGKTAARHTSAQFVAFLGDVMASQPPQREIHAICDNVSAHKTGQVDAFLAEHRNVTIHRYIRQYNKSPKPLKWKYSNPAKRIRCNSSGSVD